MKKQKLTQKQAYKLGAEYQFIDEIKLGPWSSFSLLHDPKHMGFVLARYKFCAKMLGGKNSILEVGCGDAFGTPILAQNAGLVFAIDPEWRLIKSNRRRLAKIKNLTFECMDICRETPQRTFDAALSIDVIEHLDRELNTAFIQNQCQCLNPDGILLIGTPNKTARTHASPRSKVQHINLKTQTDLKKDLSPFFQNVFLFSMNDEVLHTGFAPMAHYIFAMGVGLK